MTFLSPILYFPLSKIEVVLNVYPGVSLERQYEDRVQKMLAELREVGSHFLKSMMVFFDCAFEVSMGINRTEKISLLYFTLT